MYSKDRIKTYIKTHYDTIIRCYFSYYFSYYDTLSLNIFPIIFNYDRVSAPGKWECTSSNSWPIHQGMTHMCRWRMPIQLHQLEGALKEWKAAWCSVLVLLYALFFTSDKDCSCCKYVLRTADSDLCTTFLCVTPSLGNSREAAIAVWSAQTALFCYDYVTLYHYYHITLCHYYSNYFSIIAVHNLKKNEL